MDDKICKTIECTGCSACSSVCPVNAISMIPNAEGFLYPQIDTDLCVNCGLCKRICPVNNYEFKNDENPLTFAVAATDDIRKNSTSGGAFTVLADYILDLGGVVCGVQYDKKMQAEHVIITDKSDIKKLNGSKYVQSRIDNIYNTIEKYLKSDTPVLFVGCPCQVAGLQTYLKKEYNNLITTDFICHGVPSPKVLKKYLSENFTNKTVKNLVMRDKINGWSYNVTTKVSLDNEDIYINNPVYMKIFGANMSLRNSCYNCRYSKKQRVGDFTLADFWGAKGKIDDKKGLSALFINNEKAKDIFEKLKSQFIIAKPIKNYFQPQLNYPSVPHPARNDFFADINTMTLDAAYEKNICSEKNVAILNFYWENKNFGALLTAYALNKICRNLGYNVQNINYIPTFPTVRIEQVNKTFEKFRKEYIPQTYKINNARDMQSLNNLFSHFIVGSDQVFRYNFINNDLLCNYFLDFATPEKNIVAYAASFGISDIEQEIKPVKDLYKLYLKNFDSLSIREENGAIFCKKQGIQADWVLDPVFLLPVEKWLELAHVGSENYKQHDIVYYAINNTEEADILDFINKQSNCDFNGYKNLFSDISIQEWLWQIKNCKLLITNSFHASCFAIIFNKPFICMNKNTSNSIRMSSLFQKFGINIPIYESMENIDVEYVLNNNLNWENINNKIAQERQISLDWLQNALCNKTKKIIEKTDIKKQINALEKKYACSPFFKNLFRLVVYRVKYALCFNKRTKLRYKCKLEHYENQFRNTKFKLYRGQK